MSPGRVDAAYLGPDLPEAPPDDPYRMEFRQWLEHHAPQDPEPLDLSERIEFRRGWHTVLADSGLSAPHWPTEYGGRGADALLQFMYYEELALARAPELMNAPGLILLGPTLMVHGTDALRRQFLPGILAGTQMWCQGFSEPDAGSDLASLRTRADLVDGHWVINGQKTWTTFAQFADYCFVLARTEAGSDRHRGLAVLICPMNQPGVTVRPIQQISGDAEFCEVFFDDARLPEEWVVGSPGDGWAVAMTAFGFERGDQGFTDHARLLVRLHDAEQSLAEAVQAERLAPGRLAQARADIARCWARCQELRVLNYRAAILRRARQNADALGSMTNLVWGELEKDIGSVHAVILADRGLAPLNRESVHRLASRAASIYSGTSEIQRNIIAERLLGLPR